MDVILLITNLMMSKSDSFTFFNREYIKNNDFFKGFIKYFYL